MSCTSDSKKGITNTFIVAVSTTEAFTVFTKNMDSWWPQEYTWSQETLKKIEIEAHENGRCFERGPHGFECDWGRVLYCDPPSYIVFTWQIDPNRVPEPNPEKASEIEVLFEPTQNNGTQITFKHTKFDNHGEGGQSYKEALSSPKGWPYILGKFREAVS